MSNVHMFSYQGYSGEGVRKYRALLDNDETHITYEGFPCLALMIPDEIKKQLIVDPQIGTYATAYFDMPKVRENQYINIFGMEDIRHFMKTGHLPGVFDHYFYVESIELRKEMLENFHKNLLAHTRQYYMESKRTVYFKFFLIDHIILPCMCQKIFMEIFKHFFSKFY